MKTDKEIVDEIEDFLVNYFGEEVSYEMGNLEQHAELFDMLIHICKLLDRRSVIAETVKSLDTPRTFDIQ